MEIVIRCHRMKMATVIQVASTQIDMAMVRALDFANNKSTHYL